jgi:hypothetical protein
MSELSSWATDVASDSQVLPGTVTCEAAMSVDYGGNQKRSLMRR